MSDWRDQVKRAATFRGVAFFVDAAEFTTGRRNATHKFPFREGAPYIEDTGIDGRTFPVEAFVVGDDYIDQRDDLLSALEKAGPGELVHPHYGARRVSVVGPVHVREGGQELGIARIQIMFAETVADPPQPTTTVAGTAAVAQSVTAAKSSASSAFQAAFSTAGKIYDGVVSVLKGATNALNSVTGAVGFLTQDAASFGRQVSDFANGSLALASTPGDLVTQATGMFDQLKTFVLNAENVTDPLGVLLGIYGFNQGTPITPPSPTVDRAIDASNSTAVATFLQRAVLLEAASMLPSLSFLSYEDAVASRARVVDLIDEQAETITDETFPEFMQLRADLVRAVPGDSSDLPHLLAYTPRATVPSIVLSHRLYGDVDGEADILARNKIRHPGFIMGAVELEVLSRE